MYEIKLLPRATKDLDKFPRDIFNRIKIEIENLYDNPRPFGCVKLTAEDGYRIRVSDYRILYRIDDQSKIIFVYRIRHRKDAYRE